VLAVILDEIDSSWRDVVAYMNRLDPARQRLVDVVDEAAVILALSAIPSGHRLAVACRCALEVRVAREDRARAEKAASVAISAGADWRAVGNAHVPYTEMQRRRALIGPLADRRTA
jgi:hypothetical protein